ncbi:MAG: NAD(P)/FAD-dependent oxidoreductase [Planctomycetota bacterium]|jgi:flavin-dependent dehydrogenase
MEKTFDCVVIGAGPGGLTTATILADEGYKVAVVDKEKFPRYKVGESMIPYNYFPLKRIGMLEKMQASDFPKKYSVQFVSRTGKQSQPFYFSQHMDHPCSQTWQVTRDVFDNMMLNNAREHGVEIFEEMSARSLIEEGDRTRGVTCVDSQGTSHTFKAKMTVDASGGKGVAMQNLSWRIFDEKLVKVAIWGYFRGGKRDPGIDEGATTITYLEEKNWAWYIPLRDDIISVGIVGDKEYMYQGTNDLAAIFSREVKKNVWIEDHLIPAKLEGDYYVCVHRSYRSKYCAKEGLILVGDALSFIDPVFSTGMYLGLNSGELAADAILNGLKKGDLSGKQFESYGVEMCRRIEILRRLVYAFYSKDFSFKQIVMKYPDLKGAITDCLIGNLERDFSKLNEALSEFLDLPETITHGRAKR